MSSLRTPARALQFPVLVGDIGGTNARFAILPDPASPAIEFASVATSAHAGIGEAIEAAVLAHTGLRPRTALLAIAAPVRGEEIRLTNCDWVIRPRAMLESLSLVEVVILNDFEAQALAVVALGGADMVQLGGGPADPEACRVVLGPGTGLGVAGLVRAAESWVPVPGEGGHVDIGPRSPRDFEVFPHIEPIEGRVSGEQLLCGRGIVNLYRAVAAASGQRAALAVPADITRAALDKTDAAAVDALEMFVTFLGRLAGDLALVFMARGGIYLSGGIAEKILPLLRGARFRAAFEDKAPHSALMRLMPIYVVTHPLAALAGLGAYARTPDAFHISTRGRRWASPAAPRKD